MISDKFIASVILLSDLKDAVNALQNLDSICNDIYSYFFTPCVVRESEGDRHHPFLSATIISMSSVFSVWVLASLAMVRQYVSFERPLFLFLDSVQYHALVVLLVSF